MQALLLLAGMTAVFVLGWYFVKKLGRLLEQIKSYEAIVMSVNPFANAQVCCGGVDTREVDAATMESGIHANLYLAGELLDVDGICGGYNLQWAWSSGYAAGSHAAAGVVQGYRKTVRGQEKQVKFSGSEGNRARGRQERKKHTYDPDQSAHTSRGSRGRGDKEKGGKALKNR